MKIVPIGSERVVRLLALCGVAAAFLLGCAQVAEPREPSRDTTASPPTAADVVWHCADRLIDVGTVSAPATVDLAVGERATLADGTTIAIECERVEDTCPPGKHCFVGPIAHLKIVLTTPDGQRAAGDFTYHTKSKQHELAEHTVSLLRAEDEAGQPKRHRLRVDA
ncbi:MAG: hypothetical protein GEU97_21480 [Actinophytocola sp.]|nr:hypothetical protein [Actinophytocola sp.]